MNDLLTTRQLQELLQVDRTTIYRMLNSGRLKGFKVGGQWRFSRQEIEAWLMEQRATLEVTEVPPPAEEIRITPQILPLSCLQAIQDVFAEALGLGAVTTDLQGQPLTQVSNPCRFCQLILSSEEGRRRCQASWRSLAAWPQRTPDLHRCHAGLLCARGRIEVKDEFIAMIFVSQFLNGPAEGEGPLTLLPDLAVACGLDEGKLRAALPTVHQLEPKRVKRVIGLLQKMADTFSEIGHERLELLNRLRRIAEITTL